jgi:hypothetical protein
MPGMLLFGMIGALLLAADRGWVSRWHRRTARCAAGGMRLVGLGLAGLFAFACLALLPQPAVGQDRTPTPSGEELWKTYPLHPSPTPRAETPSVPSPAGSRPDQRRTGTAPDRSDRAVPTARLIVPALVVILGVLAVVGLRRRNAAVEAQGSKDPGATSRHDLGGQAPPADPDVSGSPALIPPDPHRRWTATIDWRHADAESRFCVLAVADQGEPATVLVKSEPLEWPPTDPASVQALGAAAEKLAASLVSAGWEALPPASEWYAKRFAWEPVAAELTDAPTARQQGSSRFPRPAWSDATRELWRCEIEWDPGSVNARFRAAVYPPGVRRARAVVSSAAFDVPRDGEPDPHDPECRAQVQSLAARLEAAGWEPVARGADWFAERFVWRRDGAPPVPVDDSVPTEARLGR